MTLTAQVTLDCETRSEYDDKLERIQNYTPGDGEPSCSDLVEDVANLRITYTLAAAE